VVGIELFRGAIGCAIIRAAAVTTSVNTMRASPAERAANRIGVPLHQSKLEETS